MLLLQISQLLISVGVDWLLEEKDSTFIFVGWSCINWTNDSMTCHAGQDSDFPHFQSRVPTRSSTSCEQRDGKVTERDVRELDIQCLPTALLLSPQWLSFPWVRSSSASMHRDALLPFAAARQEAATHFFPLAICHYNTNEPNRVQTIGNRKCFK